MGRRWRRFSCSAGNGREGQSGRPDPFKDCYGGAKPGRWEQKDWDGVEISGRGAIDKTWTPRKCGLRVREKGRVGRGEGAGRRHKEVSGGLWRGHHPPMMGNSAHQFSESLAYSLGWKRPLR